MLRLINRNGFTALVQIGPYGCSQPPRCGMDFFGSNAVNAFVPFYANIEHTPEYISNTTSLVTTVSFYWANRLIGALADASFDVSSPHIARYQRTVQAKGREIMKHRSLKRTKLFARKNRISTGYSTEIRYIFSLVH